eukprot:1413878-Pleurochrysis_carterae.AAC.4
MPRPPISVCRRSVQTLLWDEMWLLRLIGLSLRRFTAGPAREAPSYGYRERTSLPTCAAALRASNCP